MFTRMESAGTTDLHFCLDPASGLRAIIAIHSTHLGPAIGGCRFLPYANELDAVEDALRLAKGMSYKAALAGLPHGGGKSVIIYPEHEFDRHKLMKAFGKFIKALNGRYITAMDSGTLTTDMDAIASSTRWVSCTSQSGDPSPYTAIGVIEGIKAAVQYRYGKQDLEGLRVAIQGLGHVGMAVAAHLAMEGVHLTVTDINTSLVQTAIKEYSAHPVTPDTIYDADADIFCPCGLGAILNDATLSRLKAPIIAGSANNQLAEERHGIALAERGILYVPDYVINSGGLIYVALTHANEEASVIRHKVMQINPTLQRIFQKAEDANMAPFLLANLMAEQIFTSSKDQPNLGRDTYENGL